MKRGNSVRWGIAALAAALLAAAALPLTAAAAPEEYDLAFPGAGSGQSDSGGGGGSEGTTAPSVVPTAPTAPTETAPTTTDQATDGSGRQRDRDRDREEPAGAVLATSAVNATAGPQEIPPLQIETGEGGVPTLALVLALLAAASCILALWRLRFLRELPAAPRRPTPRPEASS